MLGYGWVITLYRLLEIARDCYSCHYVSMDLPGVNPGKISINRGTGAPIMNSRQTVSEWGWCENIPSVPPMFISAILRNTMTNSKWIRIAENAFICNRHLVFSCRPGKGLTSAFKCNPAYWQHGLSDVLTFGIASCKNLEPVKFQTSSIWWFCITKMKAPMTL